MSDLNDITEQDETLPAVPDDIPVEPEESEPVTVEKKKPVAVGYRVLSAVLLLLSVLGLFAGALAKLIPAFEPFITHRVGATESAFSYTLFALLLELFKNLSAIPKNAVAIVYVAVIMLCAVSVIVSLITALVAFCSGKRAKVCTHVNATALFLGYGAFFAYHFATASSAGYFYKGMFELPSAILAAVALIVLTVLVFVDKREAGGTTKSKSLNLLLLVLFYGCLFLFFVPTTGTATWWAETIVSLTSEGSFLAVGNSMQGIALCVIFALFVFNFLATAVRYQFKKGYLFDTVRFGLQLFAVAFVIAVAIAGSPADRMAVFKENILVTVAMIIAAVMLFIIPLLKIILAATEKRKSLQALEDGITPEEEELSEEQSVIELPPAHQIQEPIPGQQALPEPSAEHRYQPQDLDIDTILGTKREDVIDPQEKYIDDFVAEKIQNEELETMFEPTNEPNQTLSDEVKDEPLQEEEEQEEVIVFTADNFDPNNPIIFGSSSEPSKTILGSTSFMAGSMPAPEKTEKKTFVFTEFEKEMAAQAKEPLPSTNEQTVVENDPRYPFMTQTVTNPPAGQAAQPIIQQTFITPSAQPQPAPQPTPEPVQERIPERERPSYYERPVYDTQFTYDPFINTLTPDERSEFGDVFISHRHGIQNYLPTYVIGGDNREFFSLLFIQLGHYRRFISQALMDKMYAFVSHR